MIPPNSSFPWFFFWKIARIQTVILVVLWFIIASFDRETASALVPFFSLALGIFLGIFAYITRPLRAVLKRVGAIVQSQLPHERQLDLFYQKDEWAKIAAALEDADQRQRSQLKTIEEENRKFTSLLASISNEILAVDPQANVLFHNPRFLKTFVGNREKLQAGGKLWSVLEYSEARAVCGFDGGRAVSLG
jgi:signal transduction histidine kinase